MHTGGFATPETHQAEPSQTQVPHQLGQPHAPQAGGRAPPMHHAESHWKLSHQVGHPCAEAMPPKAVLTVSGFENGFTSPKLAPAALLSDSVSSKEAVASILMAAVEAKASSAALLWLAARPIHVRKVARRHSVLEIRKQEK